MEIVFGISIFAYGLCLNIAFVQFLVDEREGSGVKCFVEVCDEVGDRVVGDVYGCLVGEVDELRYFYMNCC